MREDIGTGAKRKEFNKTIEERINETLDKIDAIYDGIEKRYGKKIPKETKASTALKILVAKI